MPTGLAGCTSPIVEQVKVAVIDDDAMVREFLSWQLNGSEGIVLAGTFSDVVSARQILEDRRPDVILLDWVVPGMSGVEATRFLRSFSAASILVLTAFGEVEQITQAIDAGAKGFVTKDMPLAGLLGAIWAVYSGAYVVSQLPCRADERFAAVAAFALTDRELRILYLMGQGASNSMIAGSMFLSQSSVKSSVSAILSKVGARSRLQAVARARELGILE